MSKTNSEFSLMASPLVIYPSVVYFIGNDLWRNRKRCQLVEETHSSLWPIDVYTLKVICVKVTFLSSLPKRKDTMSLIKMTYFPYVLSLFILTLAVFTSFLRFPFMSFIRVV